MNKYTLYTRIGWALALVVLIGALCYYNLPYLMESAAKESGTAGNPSSSTSAMTGQEGSDGSASTPEYSSGQEAGSGEPSSSAIDLSIPEGGDPGMRCLRRGGRHRRGDGRRRRPGTEPSGHQVTADTHTASKRADPPPGGRLTDKGGKPHDTPGIRKTAQDRGHCARARAGVHPSPGARL